VFQFYSVEHSIGKGQFGQVKLATHKSTGQKVAVKMMAKANMKIVEAH
jgi:serine/threonine protein kinase